MQDTPIHDADPTVETEAMARRPPPPVDWTGVRKVHVMGICGSAMGAFAGMLVQRGFEVRGSDRGAYPPMSTRLAEQGIEVLEGYSASNLEWGPDVVVVGNVVRPFYEEAVAVRRLGLPYCSLPQALASLFIAGRHSVVVTGTHGKTTTSSMAAWLLHEAELDPGFMIGGITGNFGTNHRVTDGGVFVVEGDEYDTAYFDKGPKFLHYRPMTASLNNLEFDHADIFADLAAVEACFARFAAIMPADGTLLAPADQPLALAVARQAASRLWTFGLGANADVYASDLRPHHDGVAFDLHLPGERPRGTSLSLWGEHNILNALTAAGLSYAAGASVDAIALALPRYRLPAKRQQLKGVASGIPVIDDFAHHPTAIRETLKATRMRYPNRRVLALFEVESNTSRRRVFQDGFAAALAEADAVWFCQPLHKEDGLAPEARLDMDGLLSAIRSAGTPAELVPDTDELAEAVAAEARAGEDVILAMSGRNFHGIHDRLLALLAG